MTVKGQWIYMCGVVDSKGNTIDFYLREKGQTLQGEKVVKKQIKLINQLLGLIA
ncbi:MULTISPECIES: DDE-type integrase/transposase/recombinase [Bacillus cereus group]|uniref:DDE-type integrase/transposase/recombinase n=1 Tax=Bacillus cereus group TaxID=86661 RepID=UPI00352B8F06